jgi:formylglycine-generating enzyme required for sulfatase activity
MNYRNIMFWQAILVSICVKAHAQKVSNILAEQRGQDIVVLYSLETTSSCEVSLLLSQDNGVTWGSPLKNVSGDVGKNIAAGEKQINWKVLEEQELLIGDKIKFKVIANGRKLFEPEMVFVEGGTFKMGSDLGGLDEKPFHSVTLSDFNIGKYEVTQAQWKAVMGGNPSYFKGCDFCPVEQVSWEDVHIFIRKLNLQTGNNYRLPTEAEWEFAAKGGVNSKGFTYSGSNELISVAWTKKNSGSATHSVGSKTANELMIYDMSGNVWEWCMDRYGEYNASSQNNPTGPPFGSERVIRGGSAISSEIDAQLYSRATSRFSQSPIAKDIGVGFRLVLPEDR